MINGKPHEFLEHAYSGQDTPYVYHGEKYWLQGYSINNGFCMEIFHCSSPYEYAWKYTGKNPAECINAFEAAPIFGGKTFWEAEQDIEWVDC